MTTELPEGWSQERMDRAVMMHRDGITQSELADLSEVALYSIPAYDELHRPEHCSGNSIKSNKTLVPNDCVLLSKLNPRIPRVWRVRHDGTLPSICSTEFWPLTKRSDQLDHEYLSHFLRSPIFLNAPTIKPASSTNSHQRIDRKGFEQFIVTLPPPAEQKRIAEVLTSVDDAIHAMRAAIEQTRTVKKGLLQTLLTQGLGHTKFKPSPLGTIPISWELVTLGEHCEVQLGKMLSKAAKLGTNPKPYLRNASVQWDRFDLSDIYNMDFNAKEISKFALKKGDLIVCEGGEVGRCAIWNSDTEMYYQKALHRLRPKTGRLSNAFLSAVFTNVFRYGKSAAGIIGTTSIAHLTKEKLSALTVPCPPLNEQFKITEALDIASKSLKSSEQKLTQLKTLKSGLMSDLLTGRVRTVKGAA